MGKTASEGRRGMTNDRPSLPGESMTRSTAPITLHYFLFDDTVTRQCDYSTRLQRKNKSLGHVTTRVQRNIVWIVKIV